MSKKLMLALMLIALCVLSNCITLPQTSHNDCRFCGFRPGTGVTVRWPPQDNRPAEVYTADSNGCVTVTTLSRCDSLTATGISARSLTVSPSSVDLQAVPSTVTVTGEGMDVTYGAPKVEYRDSFENLVGQGTVTAYASDGSWIQVSPPDLSQIYSGFYRIYVFNLQADGTPDLLNPGIAAGDAYGRDRPTEPPPDPCSCPPNMVCMPCNQY